MVNPLESEHARPYDRRTVDTGEQDIAVALAWMLVVVAGGLVLRWSW